ncbi:winged helix DNA-binding domain-containing protein [Amycolatopsis ultiminotia]|uniref:Winged helix DNA-binding domain-containing protein n=1 Tax=Amycolatopsis ultiminotia TaxID=543629 RepID=A0ABP6W117_9PSEU
MPTHLDTRTLNRATLARQHLLDRTATPVLDLIAHLGGLQAQLPQEPFTGLCSRVAGFEPDMVSQPLEGRSLARLHLMRRTVHLVTAEDARQWRPRHHTLLRQRTTATYRRELADVDLDELAAAARTLMADGQPRSLGEIGRAVAQRWPQASPRALGETVVAALVPMVQIPPRGTWASNGGAFYRLIEDWLGPAGHDGAADEHDLAGQAMVKRYLAAFGPATTSDLRAWCGLAGLPAAVRAVRNELISFRDPRGRELLDLPDAPRPEPDTPAPVRFLPAFDNAVLGFHDRSRMIDDHFRPLSVTGARFVLVDGRVAGTWTTAETAVMVTPLRPLTKAEQTAVEEEAQQLTDFFRKWTPSA